MTIVHISIGLGGGGAEHMILELAKKSQQNNIKTIVIAISKNSQIEYKFSEGNLEVHYLGVNSIKEFFAGLKKLKKILQNYKDVIFHCHMFHALMVGVSYSLLYRKTPIVFTLHSILVEKINRRWALFLTKPFRKVDINFSKRASKWYLKNALIIANGVDFAKLKSEKPRFYDKEEAFRFLFLGRLYEEKNPLFLVDLAQKMIDANCTNFVINVAGDGNMRGELETLIKSNQLDNYIKLLGFQKDVKQQLLNAHCLIMPSLWEGLPISLIEASAAKLPIITTPVGSIPDFFNDTNAYLSHSDSFHLSMLEVLNNYSKALIKAAQLFDDNKRVFDINAVYEKHINLYNDVLKQKSQH